MIDPAAAGQSGRLPVSRAAGGVNIEQRRPGSGVVAAAGALAPAAAPPRRTQGMGPGPARTPSLSVRLAGRPGAARVGTGQWPLPVALAGSRGRAEPGRPKGLATGSDRRRAGRLAYP
jgi:hypothetical protein